MAESQEDTSALEAPRPAGLPPKPLTAPRSPPEADSDPPSPPRKRPRTKAPPRPPQAPSIVEESTMPPSIPPTAPMPDFEPSRFPIQPLARFQGASASIKRPREVAHFSYDDNHEYREDDSGINYYCPPQIGADLRDGFESFRHYEDTEDPHLDSLLRTLASKERKLQAEGKNERIKGDFVTWRGMMTKIMTAPFDNFASFEMFATLYDSTIYIEEDFPSRLASRASEASSRPPPRPGQASMEMMTYWGYKFETLALTSKPPPQVSPETIANRPRDIVSNHAQHCSIIHTAFGPHSLILGGEVDGLWGPKPADPDKPIPWIELKTSEELPPPPRRKHHDVLRFERKLLKFWAQSFLLGVEKVVVGFRSRQGVLRGVDVYDTARIPGMVRRSTNCWDGNTCINFATAFLGFLKETVKGDGIYRISLKKKAGVVEVVKVAGEGTGGIVSREFLQWRQGGSGEGKTEEEEEYGAPKDGSGVPI